MIYNNDIYDFLIESDLAHKPSSSRIKAYVNEIKKIDKNFTYKNVKDIIEAASLYKGEIFSSLFYPLSKTSFEIIPRLNWDFSKLAGNDKKFLKDELFDFSFDCVINNFSKKNDVLIVLEPFKKKPYIDNKAYNFVKNYSDKADICVASEIGVVPMYPKDFSNLYPFRYFTYIKDENAKSPLKYTTKKLEKFIKHFDYKYVLFVGVHQTKNPYMHDLYFNISMDLKVQTDWIWSLNETKWYEISIKYGAVSGISYTNDIIFKELFDKKIRNAIKYVS